MYIDAGTFLCVLKHDNGNYIYSCLSYDECYRIMIMLSIRRKRILNQKRVRFIN